MPRQMLTGSLGVGGETAVSLDNPNWLGTAVELSRDQKNKKKKKEKEKEKSITNFFIFICLYFKINI